MKKIILTLGVFLSVYATYAIGSSNQLSVEEDSCTMDIRIYDNEGRLMTILWDQPC
ncbi:hypothetical protein [Aquimarina sp. I32.4]|uniref:hypothetical protein n=1 Tax=Aquimarina sp. I32.4 TaxID=2053903 RepID=UPI001304851E|nr:hypothetical protein [Aquimarina sp. I32.4]